MQINKKLFKNKPENNKKFFEVEHSVVYKYSPKNNIIEKKYNIGLLLIVTGKYIDFLDELLYGAREYFLINHNVTFHIFTDNINIPHKNYKDTKLYKIEHKKWPYPTLFRYNNFVTYKEDLLKEDFLFYSDVDMKFVNFVNEEILGNKVATIHPGFLGGRGTPEDNPKSTAFISGDENLTYFAGGFNGGTSSEFIKMSEIINNNINKDLKNNIIAKWHDESHMNRYFCTNKPDVILDPGYCYSECSGKPLPYEKRILALDKNHAYYRDL